MHISLLFLRVIFVLSLSLLMVQCTISPRYRSGSAVILPSSGDERNIAKSLSSAPSLFTISGTSSWYGPKFHGRKTANGEVYDMNKLSAAHKEFPLGSWIRVINLKNNRKVILRVNDRGPFIEGRILDLSKKAAEELDFLIDGLAEVKIEVLRWGTRKD